MILRWMILQVELERACGYISWNFKLRSRGAWTCQIHRFPVESLPAGKENICDDMVNRHECHADLSHGCMVLTESANTAQGGGALAMDPSCGI